VIPTTDTGYNATYDTNPWYDRSPGPALIGGVTNNSLDGHGTPAAGVVVGQTYGVAKGATLHSVKICWNERSTFAANLTAGLDWVQGHAEYPAVANLSFNTNAPNSGVTASVNSLIASGVVLVVSAGNGAQAASNNSPGDNPNAIVVGALGNFRSSTILTNEISDYSNYGATVSIFAPGSFILAPNSTLSTNGSHLYWFGTSYSAPLVAAVACHYLQTHPLATPDDVKASVLINGSVNKIVGVNGANFPSDTRNLALYTESSWIDNNVIINSGIGSGSLVATDVTAPNGNVYDQVLMTSSFVQFHADGHQITRCSWIDENDDIVQAELSGSGQLRILLVNYSGPDVPVKYNQNVAYMKGRAQLTLIGASSDTYLSVFSIGTANASNQSIFQNVTYDGKADIQFLYCTDADSKSISSIFFGNAYMHTDGSSSNFTGIYMPAVKINKRIYIYDIKNTHTSSGAYLSFEDGSALSDYSGRPVIAGGTLSQAGFGYTYVGHLAGSNSTPFSAVYTNGNANSHGVVTSAQDLANVKFVALPNNSMWPVPYSTQDAGASGITRTGTTSNTP